MSYHASRVRLGKGNAPMEREAELLWSEATHEQRQNVVRILSEVLQKEGLTIRKLEMGRPKR